MSSKQSRWILRSIVVFWVCASTGFLFGQEVVSGSAVVEGAISVNGTAAADVHLELFGLYPRSYALSGDTNASGRFHFGLVREGAGFLWVFVPSAGSTILVTRGFDAKNRINTTISVDVRLGTARVQGTVTKGGLPSKLLRVFAEPVDLPKADHIQLPGEADTLDRKQYFGSCGDDGTFTIEGLITGKYEIAVTVSTNARLLELTKRCVVDVTEGQEIALDIDVGTTSGVRGVVSNARENRVYRVYAFRGQAPVNGPRYSRKEVYDQVFVAEAFIHPDGTYELQDLDPGSYTVFAGGAFSNREALAKDYVEIGENEYVKLDLTLPPTKPGAQPSYPAF